MAVQSICREREVVNRRKSLNFYTSFFYRGGEGLRNGGLPVVFFTPHYNIYSLICIKFSKNYQQMYLNILTDLLACLHTYLLIYLVSGAETFV